MSGFKDLDVRNPHQAATMLERFLDERVREQIHSGVSLERMLAENHGSVVRLMVDGECVASAEVRITGAEPDGGRDGI